jgi:hypothetical protein
VAHSCVGISYTYHVETNNQNEIDIAIRKEGLACLAFSALVLLLLLLLPSQLLPRVME